MFKYAEQVGWIWGEVFSGIADLASLGYDGVEIAGRTEYFPLAKDIAKACSDHGIAPSSICSMLADYDISHFDPKERQKGIDHAMRTVDFAAEVGAPIAILLPGAHSKYAPLTTRDEEMATGIDSMRIVAEYAQKLGIRLCVEAWDRFDNYLVTCLEDARMVVDRVDMPNVGLMLDTFHMNIEEADMAGAVRSAGEKLWHFHVGDSNRRAPGMGHIDFVPILQALKDIAYSGYVTMELIPPAFNTDAYAQYADISPYSSSYREASIRYLKEIEAKLK